MNKYPNLFGKITSYSFLLLGIVFLFHPQLNLVRIIILIGSFLASLAFYKFFRSYTTKPNLFWILTNLGLWANFLGEFGAYYGHMIYYDKALHLIIGFIITMIVYDYYSKNLKARKEVIFFTVLGILTIWEIYEYLLVVLFNFPAMGVFENGNEIMSPFDDTMYDLILGSLSSLVYLFFRRSEK